MKNFFSRSKILLLLLFVPIFLLPRIYRISEPLVDMHNVRQTQTAMITRNLLKDNFDILHTRIDWDGEKNGIVLQEFPLYQLVVSLLWKIFGIYDSIGRWISLLCSVVSAYYLFKITKFMFAKRVAIWTIIFYSISPIAVFMSRAFMINMMSFSFSLVGLYYLIIWSKTDSINKIVIATVFLTIASLINLTIIVPMVLLLPYIIFSNWKKNSKTFLGVAIFVIIFVLINLAWYVYAAHENSIYYPQWNGNSLIKHFFGTNISRFNFNKWFRISIYFVVFVSGIHGILLLPFGVKSILQKRIDNINLLIYWSVGCIVYYLFFFEALSGHNYYTLPIVPIASIIIGVSIEYCISKSIIKSKLLKIIFVFIFACSVICWVGIVIVHSTQEDTIAYEAGLTIKQLSKEKDLILVGTLHTNEASVGYPTILYYANRKGWNIIDTFDSKFNINIVDSLRNKGAKYLVLTFGYPPEEKVISFFPFLNQFSHSVKYNYVPIVNECSSRFFLISSASNFMIFKI